MGLHIFVLAYECAYVHVCVCVCPYVCVCLCGCVVRDYERIFVCVCVYVCMCGVVSPSVCQPFVSYLVRVMKKRGMGEAQGQEQ